MQIGIAGTLGLIFITLKLLGVITWPWLWVLAPFWLGIVVIAAIFAAWAVTMAIWAVVLAAWSRAPTRLRRA